MMTVGMTVIAALCVLFVVARVAYAEGFRRGQEDAREAIRHVR